MAVFRDIILYLEQLGISDVILPFFLIFTITFATLSRTKILGKADKNRRFDVIVALSLAFAVVIPHVLGTYPPGGNIVLIINGALPQVAVVLVAIVMLMLLIGAFGVKWVVGGNSAGGLWVFISLAIIIYIFGTNAGWFHNGIWPAWLWWLSDPNTQQLLVALLAFGAFVYFIVRPEPDKNKESGMKKFLEGLAQTEPFTEDDK